MMFLTEASNAAIRRFFENDLDLKAPTNLMINRHREYRHHVPNNGAVSVEEHEIMKKMKVKDNTELYNQITTQFTFKTLPKLAMLGENINVMEEKQELYAVMKNELAKELESIRARPILVENAYGEEVAINPLTKNAKELMRMMGHQLDSIEKTMQEGNSTKVEITDDLVFAFMELLGKTKLDVDDAVRMIYDVEPDKQVEEIKIDDSS